MTTDRTRHHTRAGTSAVAPRRRRTRRLVLAGIVLLCAIVALVTTVVYPAGNTTAAPHALPGTGLPTTTQARTVATTPAPAVPITTTMIRLHRGDTLWALSRRYHTTISQLQQLNHLGAATTIYAGRAFAIPAATATEPHQPIPPRTGTVITVHAGDTLSALARSHHTTVTALQQANGLGRSTLIRTGQRLYLPTTAGPTDRSSTSRDTQAYPTHAVRPYSTAKTPTRTTTARRSPHSTPKRTPSAPVDDTARTSAQSVFGSQYSCAANIIIRESGWNPHATNRASRAYGLGQALPATKMATAGPDWRTNPTTQLRWMRDYVDARYGGACAAWTFWQTHHWY